MTLSYTLCQAGAALFWIAIVRMTEAGKAYCEKVVRHITWAENTAMSMFTQDEQKQLIDLSRTFTKNLTELMGQETED